VIIQQRLQASLAPFDRPCCPECGAAMFLVEVEPDAPGSESRTYECPQCKFTERSVMRC
jgi:ribosomal protein S27AE